MFDKNMDTQMRSVHSIVPYPQVKYNQLLYTHDIALVELQNPLQLTNKVGAICLPEKEVESEQICVTAGWGFSNPGGESNHLSLPFSGNMKKNIIMWKKITNYLLLLQRPILVNITCQSR